MRRFVVGRLAPSTAIVLLLSIALLTLPTVHAARAFDPTIFDAAHLDVQVTADGGVTLTGSGTADDLQATVHYLPEAASDITAEPTPATLSPLTFTWTRARTGAYDFTYTAAVSNDALRTQITKPITYPYAVPPEITRYLQPQAITNTDQDIKNLAADIAHGETDASRIVFKTATWVHQNIAYNLTTLTAEASQSATWTLDNKQGVCDELASLFISLSREQGIPARFVSGLAYTNLPEFPDDWGPHGWAEVWLPPYGWVPVDVTYGQVFWTDTTHIPYQHTIDAKADSVEYSMRSTGLAFAPKALTTDVSIQARSGSVREALSATLTPQYDTVGSKSGDTFVAIIHNDAPYAVATDAMLETTADVTMLDARQQYVFLPAQSERAVQWRVQFPKLESGYDYTYPFAVVVGRGKNATSAVNANSRDRVYPIPPAPKEASSGIPIRCEQPPRLYIGESTSVVCTAPNSNVCADDICTANAKTVSFTATSAGAFPTQVTAHSGSESGATIVTFIVTPRPSPAISASVSPITSMRDTPVLTLTVSTEPLTNVTVSVTGTYIDHYWNVSVLEQKEFALQFPASLLPAGESALTITVEGKDKNGGVVRSKHDVPVTLPTTWWDDIELFVIHLLS